MPIDTTSLALPAARTVFDLRSTVIGWRMRGQSVGFVPTMGALHDGHISLTRLARTRADRVVVSIFVNPAQFAPHEDFDKYPRTEVEDAQKLLAAGTTDLIYAPSPREMYPQGFATQVNVGGVSEELESAARPHFFGGVATVVAKLMIQCAPDFAVFGEKDYQQVQVIKRLVRDLDMPVEIVPGPTLREADGLAMSSRNAYLTLAQRAVAGKLNAILAATARDAADGTNVAAKIDKGKAAILAAGFDSVDYLEIRDAETLKAWNDTARPGRILVAARLGSVRLIDNMAVG